MNFEFGNRLIDCANHRVQMRHQSVSGQLWHTHELCILLKAVVVSLIVPKQRSDLINPFQAREMIWESSTGLAFDTKLP